MQRIAFQDDDILKDLVAHGACTLFEKDALLKKEVTIVTSSVRMVSIYG